MKRLPTNLNTLTKKELIEYMNLFTTHFANLCNNRQDEYDESFIEDKDVETLSNILPTEAINRVGMTVIFSIAVPFGVSIEEAEQQIAILLQKHLKDTDIEYKDDLYAEFE